MKTKKIMIGLGSFVAVGVGVGAGVGIGYGVYHKSSTPHTQGLYNADGTN
ncbi:hypothetical protein FACS1894166_03990 [Bacilli bacterium]|nr:hypothetical protein FACS1894166_03990 [Bacilli bacterium]